MIMKEIFGTQVLPRCDGGGQAQENKLDLD